jgi:hypothetical protein
MRTGYPEENLKWSTVELPSSKKIFGVEVDVLNKQVLIISCEIWLGYKLPNGKNQNQITILTKILNNDSLNENWLLWHIYSGQQSNCRATKRYLGWL